jgi:hypothetical protein
LNKHHFTRTKSILELLGDGPCENFDTWIDLFLYKHGLRSMLTRTKEIQNKKDRPICMYFATQLPYKNKTNTKSRIHSFYTDTNNTYHTHSTSTMFIEIHIPPISVILASTMVSHSTMLTQDALSLNKRQDRTRRSDTNVTKTFLAEFQGLMAFACYNSPSSRQGGTSMTELVMEHLMAKLCFGDKNGDPDVL